MTERRRVLVVVAGAVIAVAAAHGGQPSPRALVIDDVRVVDGRGGPAIEAGRIVVRGDRLEAVGAAATTPAPADAERVNASGATVLPGLVDLHFHIEEDPKLALRQLAHGVTAFRDPGEWFEKFDGLTAMIRADGLPGPRMFLCGPHIDGEQPAYPEDAVVARDPEEARRHAERAIDQGATAIKIYFRLPLASARAVIDVCRARGVPCTAHLELLDARVLLSDGLHGVEHITSFGVSLVPAIRAERYRQAVLKDNRARSDGRYALFAETDLDGPEARALYDVVRATRPFVDATLAVFEVREGDQVPKGSALDAATRVRGFVAMKALTRRLHAAGARLVVGGHTSVPHAGRGEAPWREMELLVEAGLSPADALVAATRNGAAFLGRDTIGELAPGRSADLIIVDGRPDTRIHDIRRISRVMVAGRWVAREKYVGY